MMKYCHHCGSSDFRTSRFRSVDLPQLLVFKLPVRCTVCRERAFVYVPEFFKMRREHEARRLERNKES